MDNDEGQFFVQSEEEEIKQLVQIQEANPIYVKPTSNSPKKVNLKMVQVEKKNQETLYQYFKIKKKADSERSSDGDGEFKFVCPFTEFYEKEQLIYQRYNNQQFNIFNQSVYFAGAFIPKNIFFHYMKQDSQSLSDIIQEYFETNSTIKTYPQPDDPVFDSNFQSGNLFAVFKIGNNEYDLVMQNDTNSRGSNQWFFFSVSKITPGVDYTFNVVNFTKNDSLFNYGMAPAVYSTVAHQRYGASWFRMGKDVTYKKGLIPRQNSRRYYYKLSFKINWKYNNDKLYIAHSYPYTFTKLNEFLDGIIIDHKEIVSKVVIGKTLSKKPIEALVITSQINKKRDTRKALIFMARQHPGETQGSFVCEGVIKKLVNKCKESQFLRKNYVIYVIPMVNPDGVIFGHYRTNLSGKDLNRKWDISQKQQTCPQVICIKSFLQEISKERQIRFVIDLHGHSKKLNSFFYGNPCPQNPQFVRVFPFVCSKLNPAVQFYDCTFATQEYKRKAARVYLSYYYKQLHVYTFESSFYGFFRDGKKHEFTPQQYANLGETLVQVLHLQLQSGVTENRNGMKDLSVGGGLFMKYLNELKNNKNLLQIGNNPESGSDSKPEDGQINANDIPALKLAVKKSQTPIMSEDSKNLQKNKSRKSNSRRAYRQMKDVREVIKPVRQFKYLQINKVNSMFPDKHQLGLQPIQKKESISTPLSRNQSGLIKISTHSQTEKQMNFLDINDNDIEESNNLSNSVKLDSKSLNERRYSSIIKNTVRHNSIIFKIQFTTPNKSNLAKKVYFNAYSQTMISFFKEKNQKEKESKALPLIQESQKARSNSIKYKGLKTGKKEAEVLLGGMGRKYLVEKEIRVIERPFNIKKKQLYQK